MSRARSPAEFAWVNTVQSTQTACMAPNGAPLTIVLGHIRGGLTSTFHRLRELHKTKYHTHVIIYPQSSNTEECLSSHLCAVVVSLRRPITHEGRHKGTVAMLGRTNLDFADSCIPSGKLRHNAPLDGEYSTAWLLGPPPRTTEKLCET